MGFLYLEDDKVKITEEGKALKETKELNASDRHKGKPFYNNVLIYTYWTYTFDGVFKDILPEHRKKEVADRYLRKTKWKDIESNKKAKAFIDIYVKTSTTFIEKSYENIKKDMEDLMKHLRSIPFTKKEHIKTTIEYGEYNERVPVNTMTDVDNSEEKLRAIKSYDVLLVLEEKIRQKVIEEKTKGKKRNKRRLFDKEG